MAQGVPKAGELYRHFKNKLYQVITIAQHSETGESMVVYQALYHNFEVYVRPLSMFIGEVNHEKYPEVQQKFRFSLVKPQTAQGIELDIAKAIQVDRPVDKAGDLCGKDKVALTKDMQVDPELMAFLDANTLEQKYHLLVSMEDKITDRMINNMAVVLDVVIPEGNLDKRYMELKKCIKMLQKYEIIR
ncbi:DUF1653 domain-containing protein [Lachnospiraceae bacterium ZAX-1]